MRKFIRYALCGSEGLRTYLIYLGAVFGGLLAMHLVLFAVMISAKADTPIVGFYEVLGTGAAAIGYALLSERLLRISVQMGVSRRNYLRGMLLLTPVFALITTAAEALTFAVTDGIMHLGGCKILSIGNTFTNHWVIIGFEEISPYQPRIAVFNLLLIFCILIWLYSSALIYTALKTRFRLPAGLIGAGALTIFSFYQIIDSYFFTYSIMRPIINRLYPEIFAEMIAHGNITDASFGFIDCLLRLPALALLWYLLIIALFALLLRRSAVCGKEEEGDI